MRLILSLFILMFPFQCLLHTEEWSSVPLTSQYYKNEFKKVHFHLGIGLNYGGVYYFNYTDHNIFAKYGLCFRLAQERPYGRLGLVLKLAGFMENETFTDDSTYYGYHAKMQGLFLAGANLKLRSFIPYTQGLIPYLLLGGGVMDISYEHSFRDKDNMIRDNELRGFTGSGALNAGTEIELVENLLYVDLGFGFIISPNIQIELNPDNGENSRQLEETMSEVELTYYAGFIFNLF